MIEKERIAHIKSAVDLVTLAEARGIRMKKNGKSWFGLCPFHEDKNPSFSITPVKNEWHCFGCGKGGDVIKFVELFDRVTFIEAVKRLSTDADRPGTRRTVEPGEPWNPPQEKPRLTAKLVKLFQRVIEFYQTAFGKDQRAKAYLNSRGIRDAGLFSDYRIGFADGSLVNVLPYEGDTFESLVKLGILNQEGEEHFLGCLVFPLFDEHGQPAGMYGRRIPGFKGPDHLYLPGKMAGLFNRECLKTHKTIILTEAVIDSLTLIQAGIKNTIPSYGVNGLISDHINSLYQNQVKTVYIAFDADKAGQDAMPKVKERLGNAHIKALPVTLPYGWDVNDFFIQTENAAAHFQNLLAMADPEAPAQARQGKPDQMLKTDYGFTLTTSGREYEVRGIVKRDSRLKATVKGIKTIGAKRNMHVDTVDFYAAKSRLFLVKGLCDLFGADEAAITADVEKLMEQAEAYTPEEQAPDKKDEMSATEQEAALAFLKNPAMFAEILADFETLGYTGEEMNKLLCYVAVISRMMESPISVMIQSRSAAGKSFLQDTVLLLIPEADAIKYTRLTDQALFYKENGSLKHKTLAIEELDGMNGAIYSIRSIQSSKKITIAYTGKDPATGRMRTEENTVEGPLMVFITTTQVDIDGETASRFVFIAIDESEEMTRKILAKQREAHTMAGMLNKLKAEAIIKKHRNANQLLRPLQVFNPYADLLTFTSKSLRARRDHTKYLNLILAIAYLFQYQRKVRTMDFDGKTIEYINVTLSDIEKANTIADYVLGRSLDELPPPSRSLLALIRQMTAQRCRELNIKPEEYRFNRRDIREFSGWSDFQVKTHIRQLEELEYIYAVVGKKGKEYVYELLLPDSLDETRPFLIGLTDIRQLKRKAEKLGIQDDLEGQNLNLEG